MPRKVPKKGAAPRPATQEDPSTPIVVRHSALKAFRECPLKHRLAWLDGWWSPERELGGARHLGTLWHEVLKVHYRYLKTCQEMIDEPDRDELDEEVGRVIEGAPSDMREQLYWMYDNYVEANGWDSQWKILAVEETMRVPFHDEDDKPLVIPDPRFDVNRPVLYEWTSDILVHDPEFFGEMVVDNKSTSQPLKQHDIDLDDQFGLYTVAWHRLGRKIRGQLVNQTKTKKLVRPQTPAELNSRTPSIRTEPELREIELDAVGTIRTIYSENNLRRASSSPNPRMCGWACDFKEPHLRLRRMTDPAKTIPMLRSFGLEQGATHGKPSA